MINVLFLGVLPLWEDRGDAIHLRELTTALSNSGINPCVVSLPGPQAPENTPLTEIRVPVVPVRFLRQVSWNIGGTLAAIKAVRDFDIDVIYTRLEPGSMASLWTAKMTRKPLVVEMNGLPSEDVRLYRPHNATLLKMTRKWEAMMYREAARIIGSPGYVQFVQEHFKLATHRFCVAPLGVNTSLFAPQDRQVCQNEIGLECEGLVAWTGGLTKWQGLGTLVEAAACLQEQLPRVRFLVVGDGPQKGELINQLEEKGLINAFILPGHVPYSRVPDYLGCAKVCVATFPGNRGGRGVISSLKTLNYLACGRPTITTEMDEIGELISAQGAGCCIPPDDPAALAKAIEQLLGEPADVWSGRCRMARILAESRDWRHKSRIVTSCLQELAHG